MDFAAYHGNVTDDNGTVVPMATVTVRHTDTGALARLYSTRDGSEPKSNPFQTDAFGNIQFFAAGGSYTIIAHKGNLERRWAFVPIGTAQEYDIDGLAEFLNSGVMYYRTYAEMAASSPASFPAAAVVLSDADGSKNGYYTNNGSGWVFARTLPDSIARANIYSGDVNNPRANISAGINPSAPIVFFLDVEEQNTGSVTLVIDGIGSGVVLNAAGNVLSAGEWFGRVMLTREEDGRWRIVNDPASAIAAAASASEAGEARDAAVTAKDAAVSSANAASASADNAASSASSANTAKDAAETAANAAADSKSAAETSANSAASSANSASDSATSASASKDAAATSANAAESSASAASTSASSATTEAARAKEEADRAEQAAASVEFPVSYKEQDLTPSEQAQAKKNIAADIVFNSKTELEITEISANTNAVRLNGYDDLGDGRGGLYIDADNGSTDTIVSGGATSRMWWRVKDVSRERISAAVKSVLKNPYEFGAVGDGVADDGAALRAMFEHAGDIYIPDGNYRVQDGYIRLFSDTNVTLSPKARIINDITDSDWRKACLFVNGEQGTSNNQGGYDNTKNIHFSGGVIDGSGRADRGLMCSLFNIAHHRNISFRDMSILKYAGNTHAVEINSTDVFYFGDVVFDGYFPNGASIGTREAINIDWSSENGFPEFGPWDGTICRNGMIERCKFKDVDVGAGSHSMPDTIPHQNITIRDCEVISPLTNGFDVQFFDRSNSQYNNNQFTLTVPGSYDYGDGGAAFIDGRFRVSLPQDAVVSIPTNRIQSSVIGSIRNPQGIFLLSGHSASSSSPRGMAWGHFAEPLQILPMVTVEGATQVNYTTGEITGTTGEPGTVTVSVASGKLMIANRRNGRFLIDVMFMNS